MHALDWLRDGGRPARDPDLCGLRQRPLPGPGVDRGGDAGRCSLEAEGEAAVTRFAGAQATLADVLDELFTLPFFSRSIDGWWSSRRPDTFVTRYLQGTWRLYVGTPSTSGTLLLQVKVWTVTTNLAKAVDRVGLAIDCNALPERQSQKVVAWLTQYARTRCDVQIRFAGATANPLVELVGLEIGILAAEVEKLAVFAGESKPIERSDVARMVGAGRVETVWKALDAAATGQTGPALELLDNLLAAGEIPVRAARGDECIACPARCTMPAGSARPGSP